MRTSIDVIHRIQHDDIIDQEQVVVGYQDRFLGVIEKSFNSFVWCKVEMASIYDLAIPKHRIEYFKYHNEIVWSKKDRIDKVFGSLTNGDETIAEVVQRHGPIIEIEKLQSVEYSMNNLDSETVGRNTIKSQPTHFICIPLQNEELKQNTKKIQNHMKSIDSRLEESFLGINALHVSLVMLRCPTAASVERAKLIFKSFSNILSIYVNHNLAFTFKTLKTFNGRVLYSPPVETARLDALVQFMKHSFSSAGIQLVGNFDPFRAHMTIAKLGKNLSRAMNHISSDCYSEFADMCLGSDSCRSIELCEIYQPKDEYTGFYRTICTVSNNLEDSRRVYAFDNIGELFLDLRGYDCIESTSESNKPSTSDSEHDDSSLDSLDGHSKSTVLILRGLPGCGKSTLANNLVDYVHSKWVDKNIVKISADDKFANGVFDRQQLSRSHEICRIELAQEVKRGTDIIILDNTNISLCEYDYAIDLCRQHNASAKIIEFVCANSEEEALLMSANSIHKVPPDSISRMWSRWVPDSHALLVHNHSLCNARCELCPSDFNWSWGRWLEELKKAETIGIEFNYIGAMLNMHSRQELFSLHPARHLSNICGHHVTLIHANDLGMNIDEEHILNTFNIGDDCLINEVDEMNDSLCQGLVVDVNKYICSDVVNALPISRHITISHDSAVRAKYTKNMIASVSSQCQVLSEEPQTAHCSTSYYGSIGICVRDKHAPPNHNTFYLYTPIDLVRLISKTTKKVNIVNIPSVLSSSSNTNECVHINSCKYFHIPYTNNSTRFTQVNIFDFDDTLFYTPSKEFYSKGGRKGNSRKYSWICSSDSLSLNLPMHNGPAYLEFLKCAQNNDSIIVLLTGRHEALKQDICNILQSRNILKHFHGIVCKPTSRESTELFKAQVVSEICRTIAKEIEVHVWDDKQSNLNAIIELHVTNQMTHVLHPHCVSPVPPYSIPLNDHTIIESWAESSGMLADSEFTAACERAVTRIHDCWTYTHAQLYPDVNSYEMTRICGSSNFCRRTDADMVLINCHRGDKRYNEIYDLQVFVSNLSTLYPTDVMRIHFAKSIGHISILFEWSDLPHCEVDISMLSLSNTSNICENISLSEALSWSVREYAKFESKIDSATAKILYSICVYNTCTYAIQKVGLSFRDFGALLCACRRVMEKAFCFGTVVNGVRSFLLALSLVEIIDSLAYEDCATHISVDLIFSKWISFHKCSDMSEYYNMYRRDLVADYHLYNIKKTFRTVSNELNRQSIYEFLDVLGIPDPQIYSRVKIVCSQIEDNTLLYSLRNTMKGILTKYCGRLIRDGHQIVNDMRESFYCNDSTIVIASLNINKVSLDAFLNVSNRIISEAEMFMKDNQKSKDANFNFYVE
jgi:predicted kinase/uncharacterized protein (UPF0248 family)